LFEQPTPIFPKRAACEATNVFEHDRSRSRLIHKSQCLGEQIALIVRAKLLTRNREGWARYAPCQEVNSAVLAAVDRAHIAFQDCPRGTILPKRPARCRIDLDRSGMLEAS